MIEFEVETQVIDRAASEHIDALTGADEQCAAGYRRLRQRVCPSENFAEFVRKQEAMLEQAYGRRDANGLEEYKQAFMGAVLFAFLMGLRSAELQLQTHTPGCKSQLGNLIN